MISTQDHQVRQIFLNRQHSENVKPSWFGESRQPLRCRHACRGHVGISDETYIDRDRTRHTDQLHVVARFRLVDNVMTLEANAHVGEHGRP